MPLPLILASGTLLSLMGVSLISYQSRKNLTQVPAGYETSSVPVTEPLQLNSKLPALQDPVIYAALIKAIKTNSIKVDDNQTQAIIDQTDDDLEFDTEQIIAALNKEIEQLKIYQLAHFQHNLAKANTEQDKAHYQELVDQTQAEITALEDEIKLAGWHDQRNLTAAEKDNLIQNAAEKMLAIKNAQEIEMKTCKCTITPYLKPQIFRRNMSSLSADYQAMLSGTTWEKTRNSKSGKMSTEIKEWLYSGPAGTVDFDGWLPTFCLLLEMKANYDSLMFSRTRKDENGLPEFKKTGRDKLDQFNRQAKKHNEVCLAHPPARCCWVFMTPHAYNRFISEVLKSYPAVTAIYVPLL